MYIINLFKKYSFIRKLLLYLYHKKNNRRLVKFWYSSELSYRCKFEGMNMIGRNANFYGTLGYGTEVGDGCFLSAEIGRFSSIGSRCTYTNATHPFKAPYATTNSLFYSLSGIKSPTGKGFATEQTFDEFRFYDKKREIVNKIGSDVWIGLDVNLIGGVKISDGAVVLSRAVVTKDVPPYAIVGGIPAKVIGYRYDEETIEFLLHTKWWNNSEEWFKENWRLMNDIEALKEYYKHHE